MGSVNLVFSDYTVIGLKEDYETIKGPVYFSLLGSPPAGKPPVKVEACCFEEVKQQLGIFKVRNGSRIVCSAKWQTYKKNGKVKNSFKITDISLLPIYGLPVEVPQVSNCNLVFTNFKITGLDDAWAEKSKVYFMLTDEKSPIRIAACCFEDMVRLMKTLKLKEGSYINATAKWQTYMNGSKVMDSFKITNIELADVICKPVTKSEPPEDISCDLDLL